MIARRATYLLLAGAGLALAGCRQGMYDQAKFEPYEGTTFIADGRSARPLVAGTIPRGYIEGKKYLGKLPNGQYQTEFPMPVDKALLLRGQERFNIYCSMCHGRTGYGDGIVVQRGFPPPPSYHQDRLRKVPPGYIVDVITNGFGVMYPYNDRVLPEDRWAIAAYIKALQRSQNATLADVPADKRDELDKAAAPAAETATSEKNP